MTRPNKETRYQRFKQRPATLRVITKENGRGVWFFNHVEPVGRVYPQR